MSESIGQFIQELTGGRGFIFVIMAYEHTQSKLLYDRFKAVVEKEFGLACLRADDVKGGGEDLLFKIHHLIERADLVIAEISKRGGRGFSPNVYYEVGFAAAKGKPLLLLVHADTDVPTDLKGRETIRYGDQAIEHFDSEFRQHLRLRLGSRVALLRDLLLPEEPVPSVIVASPKYPSVKSRIQGHRYDRRTFGDNLGIVGLLSAFGTTLGEFAVPELVSANYYSKDLEHEAINLYLVGSQKVNELGGRMLALIQANRTGPNWYIGREPKKGEKGDYAALLYGTLRGHRGPLEGTKGPFGDNGQIVHVEDYGIIVRAPHPAHPSRIVVVMAGAHSLGTGAACIAATRSAKIDRIRAALGTSRDALGDKSQAIWALVRGKAGDDGMLAEDLVEVVEAGVYANARDQRLTSKRSS